MSPTACSQGNQPGAILFEGEEAASATWRARADETVSARDELFAQRLADAQAFAAASEGLETSRPDLSVRRGLWVWQRLTGWALLIAYLVSLFAWTDLTLSISTLALSCIFGLLILLRITAALGAMIAPRPAAPAQLAESQLLTLTILVPLRDEEPNVVRNLVAAIAGLDYPTHKLDVKLLIEADDDKTLAAVTAIALPDWFEIIPVPPGQPRTKPKALNLGLANARGQIIAVFDAEDRPSPQQPRAAMAALADDKSLAVVQAPLLIHNGRDGWIARQFEIEYAIHFCVWLPLLARLRLPLALGGTSNYFRRDALQAAGCWDAWNVTEDADIGLRLARFGGDAGMIAPPTLEEAPARFAPWMKQRTRWMKGHLQTWLVLMRRPLFAAREMGPLRFLATQLTLGGSLLASLMHLPLLLWVIASVSLLRSPELWHLGLFGAGYASVVVAALAAKTRTTRFLTLLTLPLYWPLQSIAMLFALVAMTRNPHYWAKTPHGSSEPASSPPSPVPRGDNVIQLEFPFDSPRD